MTENLAGRGEGLAGLEAKALAEFTAYFVENYPGPDTVICKPEWHAPKIFRAAKYAMREMLAALEAAAPAGTAPALERWEQLFYEAFCEDREADMRGPLTLGERCKKYADLAIALASDHLQPVTRQPYEHMLGLYQVEGHWYVDIDATKDASGIANGATPERAMENAKEMLGHMRDALATPSPQAPPDCFYCHNAHVMGHECTCVCHGSPRKVGEDAIAARLDEARWWRAQLFSRSMGDYYKATATQINIEDRRISDLEEQLTRLRPSSVPVGEQKQEEGV